MTGTERVWRVSDTETTTVWRDGEVLRTDRFGRTRSMPPTDPMPTENPLEEPVEL